MKFNLGSRQEITYPKFGLVIFSDSKARRRRTPIAIGGSVTDEQRCYLEKEQYKWVDYFLPAPLHNSLVVIVLFFATNLTAQVSTQWGPDGYVKIENGSGGMMADLEPGDRFSRDHDQAGDINGDGIIDLVIGARSDDDGATDAGAVYIAFLNRDGTVQSNQKISNLEGGFEETLVENNFFGYGVAGIGDYDNDGIPDIAASAPASTNRALYIIHLNRDGTVKDFVKNPDIIAQGLSVIGDLNNDGRIDLVACNPNSNDGGMSRGAISILFLDDSSQVMTNSTVTISSESGGFGTGLENNDRFGGREVAMLGDIDGDGTQEMAVGAFMSDGGRGAIWILSLDNSTFNVVSKLKITEGLNGFSDTLTTGANPNGTQGASFGHALCSVGDLNGDGVPDLMTGANQQNEGWGYILYLNADKTVKTYTRINNAEGGFGFTLTAEDRFSRSISFLGDLRGDGTIAVNYGAGAGAGSAGALYLLFFKPCAFNEQAGLNFWSGGRTLYSNWTHNTQTVSDSLTFEQCTFKAFETDAAYITYNANDGRCICKDADAVLTTSTELSTAFINECYSGFVTTNVTELNDEYHTIVYPNPTNSELILSTKYPSFTKQDRVELFSILGKRLYASNINAQQTELNLSDYPKGIYILLTSINGTQETFKIRKE